MANRFKILALVVACLVMVGCASKKSAEQSIDPTVAEYQKFRRNYDVVKTPDLDDDLAFDNGTLPKGDTATTSVVLKRAHKAIGTPYVYGGTKPGGFDCSGLVQWAYKGAGIKLPRTAREQSQAGYRIKDKSQMRPGDIVAFKRSRGGYHTGIYLGDGKFIHAPRTNTRVRIESMETGYFARNFIGARRVDTSEPNVALAEATNKQDRQLEERSQASKKAPLVAKKSTRSAKSSRARATVHTVKYGDTLSGLAARHGVSVKQIVAANKLKDAHSLRIGQKLTIPAKSTAQASKSSKSSKQTAQASKSKAKQTAQASKAKTKQTAQASKSSKSSKSSKQTAQASKSSKSTKQTAQKKSSAQSTAQASNAKSAKATNKQIQVRPAKRSVDEARASRKG